MKKIAELIYSFVLNVREEGYKQIFYTEQGGGDGVEYSLYILLGITILATACYYFVISKNIANATKKNYILTFFIGMFALSVLNFVIIATFTSYSGSYLANMNMWKITGINVIYYTILFEVFSIFMKTSSKAKNIDLITLFK